MRNGRAGYTGGGEARERTSEPGAQVGPPSAPLCPTEKVQNGKAVCLGEQTAWEIACGGPYPNPEHLTGDEHFMALALQEGLKGVGLSSPNPPVGCVLVKDGRILGRGVHTQAGQAHGEIEALRDAAQRGECMQGATAYVTLEPCCHHGRTPPCADALAAAGISRVVVGVKDPNPKVDGGGMLRLRGQGTTVVEGILGDACHHFHQPFFKQIKTGLPWVMLKLALGSDFALGPEGQQTQVTPPEIQHLAHALRRASDGIVVGRHTVEIDDPTLTDRWPACVPEHRIFRRLVLDSQGRLESGYRLWQHVLGQPALRVTIASHALLPGVEDLIVEAEDGRCSLQHLLQSLAQKGLSRLLVEGGAQLAQAFLQKGLVDEFHLFQSEHPVGGVPLNINMQALYQARTAQPFPGGCWRVFEKRQNI